MNTDLIGITKDDRVGYRVYSSPYVIAHQQDFILDSNLAHRRYENDFNHNIKNLNHKCGSPGKVGSTWNYDSYNIFSYTGGSPYFYVLYKQFQAVCREWVGDNRPLWIQCWLNYHQPNDVLKWHHHYDSIAHGYISIDPKNTNTRFEEFNIKNEIGKLYIGKIGLYHEVIVNEVFDTPRITIAFQLDDETSLRDNRNLDKLFDLNTGFIPI